MANELAKRIVSGAVLLAVAVVAIHVGSIVFAVLVSAAGAIMAAEYSKMCERKPNFIRYVGGLTLILVAAISILYIREHSNLIWLLAGAVIATDIGAYAAGKTIGKNKLWPAVSPNKTREGAIGGLLAAAAVGFYFDNIGVAIGISLLAQMGDLLESAAKRYFGVKDSGSIIPGHGGVLDRLDSFLLASPYLAIVVYYGAV